MYASMIHQTNGNEKGLIDDCKVCACTRIMSLCREKPWPIHVPAAAVIHEWRALFTFTERTLYIDVKLFIFFNFLVDLRKRDKVLKHFSEVDNISSIVIEY